jgi:hypothetical protein
MTQSRRITASINVTGIDVPNDVTEKPTPLLFTVSRADYTAPEMFDEVMLDVNGGTCSCSCAGSSGSGSGGCCACSSSGGAGS